MTIPSKQQSLKMKLLAIAAGLLAIAGTDSSMAATATATATANVLIPISVAVGTNLNFGNVVAGNGTVTLSTSSVRTQAGGTIAALPSGVTAAAARFDITGDTTNSFSISFSNSSVLTDSSSNTMAATWFWEVAATATPTAQTSGVPATGTLTGGAAYIYVGGTLAVGSSQVPGTYTGSLALTVDYN